MDRAAEELIVGELARLRPDDGVIGEEGAAQEGTSGVHWLVDPLDGTVNYLYGLGGWAVSVAALCGTEVVAGVVHIPSAGELFAAALGGGATCNGVTLKLGAGPSLGQALVATGFGYAAARRAHQAEVLRRCCPQSVTSAGTGRARSTSAWWRRVGLTGTSSAGSSRGTTLRAG